MTTKERIAIIDGAGVRSVAEFWQLYLDRTKPDAPADFGRNLDALWDAIEGGGPGCPVEFDRLHFRNLAGVIEADPQGLAWFEGLQKIASDATRIRITLSLGPAS